MARNQVTCCLKQFGVIAALLFFAGCTTTRTAGFEIPEAAPGTVGEYGNTIVTTFFATDRDYDDGEDDPKRMFGSERSTLRYGSCKVSIPAAHRIGMIESPSGSIFEWEEDPRKHFVLTNVDIDANKQAFIDNVREHLTNSDSADSLIFVHGFNVTFEEAAKRTAQMKFDLGFSGAAVFYTWPSKGRTSVSGYRYDEESVKHTHANVTGFIADYLENLSGDSGDIYLLAHSMGTRALTNALVQLSDSYFEDNPDKVQQVKGVILAAPDIAADRFRDEVAPAMIAAGLPITLYASSEDYALKFSQRINDAPRAGDTRNGLIVMHGIDTIDASNVDTSLLGHSYYGQNRSVLSDIFYLLHEGLGPEARFGVRTSIADTNPKTWVFER